MEKLKEQIKIYEECCNANRAHCEDAQGALKAIRNMMKYYGIAFCAHNAGLLGFKRYEKYITAKYDRLITDEEHEQLMKEENQE